MNAYKKVARFSLPYLILREYFRFSFIFIYYRKFYIRTMVEDSGSGGSGGDCDNGGNGSSGSSGGDCGNGSGGGSGGSGGDKPNSGILSNGRLVKGAVSLPPKGTPIIVISNHQNGLTDALLILFALPRHFIPVYLARADIFKKKIIARILYFFRILPIFRMRDGRENLNGNEKIFREAGNIVKKGFPICLFPEGKHQEGHWFGPVKKGFARIAFQAAEALNFPDNFTIVPVGNHYEKYHGYRGSIVFVYGKPIALSNYYKAYQENPQQAFAMLARDAEVAINKLILNINVGEDKYKILDATREVERPRMAKEMGITKRRFSLPEKLQIDRYYMEQIRAMSADELNAINPPPLQTKRVGLWRIIAWIFLSPVALIGFLLNAPSVLLGEHLAKRLSHSNKMLRSGIEYVASEILFTTILYLVYTVLFFVFFPFSLWWYLPFLALLLICKITWLEFRCSAS
ncbi:MAG: 1-acyl-sn-glycerol-3-phosphate acyltransferase [Bacteroidales bacterium]|jgi:1-acyl-sn-glycerol-3-phosphate acyltransferase|nr:1-acyl-sn-glycerol-3-phosphate acyltransferase [Bacteroidales bacterium]